MITLYEHYLRPTPLTAAFHYSVLAVEPPVPAPPSPQPRTAAENAERRWEIDPVVTPPSPLPVRHNEAADEYSSSPPGAPLLRTIDLPEVEGEGHEDIVCYGSLDDLIIPPGVFSLPAYDIDGSNPPTPSLVSDNGSNDHEGSDDDYTGL